MSMLDHFIYSAKAQVIFAYIPKVACTNWKCILRYLDGHADYLDPQIAHDRKRSGLAYLSTMDNGKTMLTDDAIPKLTCVRNPYTRILSAYLNKVKPFATDGAPPDRDRYFYDVFLRMEVFRKESRPNEHVMSFDCFLDWLEFSGDPLVSNEHWTPQTAIVGEGEVNFDYIGKFEQLETDAPILLQRMRCDIPFPSHEAVKFPPTRASELVRTYYTPSAIEKVQRIYAKDFEFLNYGTEVPL